jgi:hypothetical protein
MNTNPGLSPKCETSLAGLASTGASANLVPSSATQKKVVFMSTPDLFRVERLWRRRRRHLLRRGIAPLTLRRTLRHFSSPLPDFLVAPTGRRKRPLDVLAFWGRRLPCLFQMFASSLKTNICLNNFVLLIIPIVKSWQQKVLEHCPPCPRVTMV